MPVELPNISGEWNDKIFRLQQPQFEEMALQAFLYQYRHNTIYGQYAGAVGRHPGKVVSLKDIPFLPIRFFKSHTVVSGAFEPEAVFESSGTTQTVNSRHYVKSSELYRESFMKAFQQFYGTVTDYCIIGLLPSYLERSNSSLVVMADELIKQSNHPHSGFYLYEHEKLFHVLQALEQQQQKLEQQKLEQQKLQQQQLEQQQKQQKQQVIQEEKKQQGEEVKQKTHKCLCLLA